jgi:hypothetical protein
MSVGQYGGVWLGDQAHQSQRARFRHSLWRNGGAETTANGDAWSSRRAHPILTHAPSSLPAVPRLIDLASAAERYSFPEPASVQLIVDRVGGGHRTPSVRIVRTAPLTRLLRRSLQAW